MNSVCIRTFVAQAPSREAETLLIDRTLQGLHEAFGDLVEPYLALLTRYARVRLRNPWEADDAV